MLDNIFKILFVVGWIAAEVIRFPHRTRNKQDMRQHRIKDSRVTTPNFLLDILAFAGMQVIPIFYVLTPWFDFADYRLPAWAGVVGAAVFAVALWLL